MPSLKIHISRQFFPRIFETPSYYSEAYQFVPSSIISEVLYCGRMDIPNERVVAEIDEGLATCNACLGGMEYWRSQCHESQRGARYRDALSAASGMVSDRGYYSETGLIRMGSVSADDGLNVIMAIPPTIVEQLSRCEEIHGNQNDAVRKCEICADAGAYLIQDVLRLNTELAHGHLDPPKVS